MYKRLAILSGIILAALCGLVWMGYSSIQIREQGMEGKRLGEFAAVAEQIRQDVNRKLDEFIRTEQERPYTEYQYYYVPENVIANQQQMPVLRSPLGGRLDHGLAYGNFQIEPDGMIITPNDLLEQKQVVSKADSALRDQAMANRLNVKNNLLPALDGTVPGSLKMSLESVLPLNRDRSTGDAIAGAKGKVSPSQRAKTFPVESLKSQGQKAQVIEQKRSVVEQNIASNTMMEQQQANQESATQPTDQVSGIASGNDGPPPPQTQPQLMPGLYPPQQALPEQRQADTIQVRIEPFAPVFVPGGQAEQSVFGGQVFLLRHVQVENKHFLQGFLLNEKKLIEEVEESASRLTRDGMRFELSQSQNIRNRDDITYAAILDFGFGELALNLGETDPAWISRQVGNLRLWYFSIVGVVLIAVALGLISLWSNAAAQIRLARKKDDFLSAVSHELRTPLTAIRMYAEMLEKNWVKSQDKAAEYYRSMRQESERLSRLIENVLDFSRIQRGRKKYVFNIGDINKCVTGVAEMMKPYAAQKGFVIKMEAGQVGQSTFDCDAVTQIVINLLDNAIKYARDAGDKTVTVRTASADGFTLIEVEDHGPGIPHRQRQKVFDAFYRSEAEATRETMGTGLGLALVKKFAEAHNGFVEILSAKPNGVVFRVALSVHIKPDG